MFPLHAAIDVFHMPLFFFLAGMTLKQYDNTAQFVINKINRIAIPYLFFSIFWSVVNFLHPLLGEYSLPLWFLNTLFFTLVVCQLLLRCPAFLKSAVILGCFIVTYLINHFGYCVLPFDFDIVFRSSIFVFFGYLFSNNSKIKDLILNDKRIVLLLASLLLCSAYFISLYLMLRCSMIKDGEGFLGGKPFGRSFFIIYIAAFSAILFLLCISKFISKIRIINWLGKNSLVILCVHFPFTQYWNTFISTLPFFCNTSGKVLLALFSYVVIIVFCLPWIIVSKRYLPQLTGYKSFFNN